MPKPNIGLGLRHPHYQQAIEQASQAQAPDFVELHAENFFAAGGISHRLLDDICQSYPLSIHGTSLGLGSQVQVPEAVLTQFCDLVKHTQAVLVSEHLCFNRALLNDQVVHTGDLLPIAYNRESLAIIVNNIQQVQTRIQRPLLIENLSAYLRPSDIHSEGAARDEMSEQEFLLAMCKASGCGLLLDLNNLLVNALNQAPSQGLDHALAQLSQLIVSIPPSVVGEIHLAGYTPQQDGKMIIDDHGQPVSDACWQLYTVACAHFGNVPTLIEWDTNLPSWQALLAQAQQARTLAHGAVTLSSNKAGSSSFNAERVPLSGKQA